MATTSVLARIALLLPLTIIPHYPASAYDNDWGVDGRATSKGPPVHWMNLRLGASSNFNGYPEIGIEIQPLAFLENYYLAGIAIEARGTGSGFLHSDPAPETAHFLLKMRVVSWKVGAAWLETQVGLGFAELQVGEDTPGFDFGGVGALGTETAGPEGVIQLRLLYPLTSVFELVAELHVAVAYFEHAPKLVSPRNELQPEFGLSVGIGF